MCIRDSFGDGVVEAIAEVAVFIAYHPAFFPGFVKEIRARKEGRLIGAVAVVHADREPAGKSDLTKTAKPDIKRIYRIFGVELIDCLLYTSRCV